MKIPLWRSARVKEHGAKDGTAAAAARSSPRVAMFTPMPPASTGTADYAAELIAALEQRVDLEVLDHPQRGFQKESFDRVVYQIGNNPHHLDIYKYALDHPGVVVLHEANLHHLIQTMTLHVGDVEGYAHEVLFELYGADASLPPSELPAIEIPETEEFTMIRRLAEAAQAFIVHSHWAAWSLRLKGFAGPIRVIPHGVNIRPSRRDEYRTRLGVGPEELVVGAFGYQRPSKREDLALRAFQNLRRSGVAAKFLTVGESHPEVAILESAQAMGVADDVIHYDHPSLEDFEGLLSACDVVVNLRSPTYGEVSGVMMRAFAAGRTVIVSSKGAFAEAPEDICLRIELDDFAEDVLTECLRRLAADEEMREQIGGRAREWVREHCSWETVAGQYERFLTDLASNDRGGEEYQTEEGRIRYVGEWIKRTEFDQRYFDEHAARFARLLALTPPGNPESRLVELGCYMHITPAFERLLGYGDVRGAYLGAAGQTRTEQAVARGGDRFLCRVDLFDAERDVFPYESESVDCVVCSELLEHLGYDPMHLLFEVNRILKTGGTLVLSTPNVVSLEIVGAALTGRHPSFYSSFPPNFAQRRDRHDREYTPEEVRVLLTDAGLSVQRIETGPYGRNEPSHYEWVDRILAAQKLPRALRGRCTFAVAVKRRGPRARYPSWLYDSDSWDAGAAANRES